jgi:Right handed beta helix region/FlgD Ig-like domain
MKRSYLLILILIHLISLHSETHIPAGNVTGNWSYSNQPYIIDGNIFLQQDEELSIEPGVQIVFSGHYYFKVYGKLTAVGSINDTIRFTAQDAEVGWNSLTFHETTNNGQGLSLLNYCLFEYGNGLTGNEDSYRGGALYCYNSSNVHILNSRFTNNQADYGGAVALYGSDVFMQNCVIDNNYGSHDAGGILIRQPSTPILENIIISENSCYFNGGGVLICSEASPILNNVIISNNTTTCDDGVSEPGGAGISCWNSDIELNNVSILNNISCAYGKGGGIESKNGSTINFTDGIISNNQARWGGGIINDGTINLAGVTISYNSSEHAGGIYQLGELNFDPDNRCNIYLNNATGTDNIGNDLLSYDYNSVIVDTFTVLIPTDFHTYPIYYYTFNILHPKVTVVASDLYVSPLGSSDNSGLSSNDPLLTIYQALQIISPDSLNHLTIHLDEGTYSPSATGEIFPIQMIDHLTIEGISRTSTILDAEQADQVIEVYEIEDSFINNLAVTNGSSYGLYCSDSQVNIQNVYSFNNHNGIALYDCTETNILNTIIAHNNSTGLVCNYTDLFLSSVSIFENSGGNIGGGAYFVSSTPEFDSVNRCSIYLNSADYLGQDIAVFNDPVYAILDTFTVMEPVEFFCFNFDMFTFDIENAKVETVDSDLYVSPNGSDENTGLTVDEPLKTLTYAYLKVSESSQNPQTIFLAEGIYSPSQTDETFPLKCRSYVTLSGTDKYTTILDGEQSSRLLSCYYSNFCIENLTVTNSNSSSIYMGQYQNTLENLELNELIIADNYTSGVGAGIYCHDCDPTFNNLIVQNNFSEDNGGGIYLNDSNPTMSNVTIKNNFAGDRGGGLYCHSSVPNFSSEERSNIFLNETANGFSRDLYNNGSTINVSVDTFTVNFPDDYFAQPINRFNFDILHYVIEQIDQDVYVSPNGSDTNSGLTSNDPFKTISYALSRIVSNSPDLHTIHLAEGVYSPSETGEIFPIHSKDYITIEGSGRDTTILDAEEQARVFLCYSEEFIVEKVTIRNGNAYAGESDIDHGGGIYLGSGSNIVISDAIIKNNNAYYGGGIYNSAQEVEIRNVIIENNNAVFGGGYYGFFGQSLMDDLIIRDNIASNGGGIYSDAFSEIELMNVLIFNNQANNGVGGGLCLTNGADFDIVVINSTIYNNSASEFGGGFYVSTAETVFINSICWNNSPEEFFFDNWNSADFEIDFSNIEGGENSIVNNGNGQVIWEENNIDSDPLFCDPSSSNFYLQQCSPCIDAGTDYYEWNGNVILDLSPDEYYGDAPDMGAFEWEGTPIENEELVIRNYGLTNFPNPFNPETKISFSIPEDSKVELSIYNMKGQKVKQLVSDQLTAGEHSIVWKGEDNSSKPVSSGIYFYKLKSGNFEKTKKMLLIK